MRKKKLFRIAAIPNSLSGLLPGQLKFLNQYFDVYGVASPGDKHVDLNEREGVKSFSIRIERRIHIYKDFVSLFQLFFLFLREKPDIIHSITPKAGLLSMIAGFFARVPIRIHTFTGLIFPTRVGFMHYLLKNMDRLTCLFATKLIPEGQGVKNDLLNNRITIKPLEVIANGNVNGIDTSYYSPNQIEESDKHSLRLRLGISNNDFVYTFVGRLVSDKGINELIKAFNKLNEKFPNCKLVLVGDYEPKLDPITEFTLGTIQNHPSILETGWQDDVRPYLAISDVFTFPSYREGFPNVIMQAGAMEIPCIASDINGCNEIIENGVNGIIIPPKDEEALYSAMEDLFVNNEKRKLLTHTARKIITGRYEEQLVWNELLNEYRSMLSKT